MSSAQNHPLASHLTQVKAQALTVASKVLHGALSLPLSSSLQCSGPAGLLMPFNGARPLHTMAFAFAVPAGMLFPQVTLWLSLSLLQVLAQMSASQRGLP